MPALAAGPFNDNPALRRQTATLDLAGGVGLLFTEPGLSLMITGLTLTGLASLPGDAASGSSTVTVTSHNASASLPSASALPLWAFRNVSSATNTPTYSSIFNTSSAGAMGDAGSLTLSHTMYLENVTLLLPPAELAMWIVYALQLTACNNSGGTTTNNGGHSNTSNNSSGATGASTTLLPSSVLSGGPPAQLLQGLTTFDVHSISLFNPQLVLDRFVGWGISATNLVLMPAAPFGGNGYQHIFAANATASAACRLASPPPPPAPLSSAFASHTAVGLGVGLGVGALVAAISGWVVWRVLRGRRMQDREAGAMLKESDGKDMGPSFLLRPGVSDQGSRHNMGLLKVSDQGPGQKVNKAAASPVGDGVYRLHSTPHALAEVHTVVVQVVSSDGKEDQEAVSVAMEGRSASKHQQGPAAGRRHEAAHQHQHRTQQEHQQQRTPNSGPHPHSMPASVVTSHMCTSSLYLEVLRASREAGLLEPSAASGGGATTGLSNNNNNTRGYAQEHQEQCYCRGGRYCCQDPTVPTSWLCRCCTAARSQGPTAEYAAGKHG
jgi:hypothetical protein